MSGIKGDKQARKQITVEKFPGFTDATGTWHDPVWELWTPQGWCFETNVHLKTCINENRALSEKQSANLEKCATDCYCWSEVEERSE